MRDPLFMLSPHLHRSDEILRTISAEIATGTLAPGTKLDEETLCERFGASRTPVREALRQLAAQGMVELRPRQGAFVTQLTVELLIEMFETMAFLEAACAALAARRHTAEDRRALKASHEACVAAAQKEDPLLYYEANARLHECLYRASHNQHLETMTLELRNRLEAYRREITFHPGLMALSNTEHGGVLEAVLAMDEQAAAARMSQHLDTLRKDAVSMAQMLAKKVRPAAAKAQAGHG